MKGKWCFKHDQV